MAIIRLLAAGAVALYTGQASSAVLCDISGKNKSGMEFIFPMEQAGADKSTREELANQVGIVHTEDDDYYPAEIILRNKSGKPVAYPARHCIVRLVYNEKSIFTESSLIRCASWERSQLQGVRYRFRTASGAFICEKNCSNNVPNELRQEDCNAEE